MPGYLLQQQATVMCMHGGQALPTVPNARVTLGGLPSSVVADPWTVIGCPGVPPAGVPPCVTAPWVTGTTRVTSSGQPLVVQAGEAICAPTATPLLPVTMQTRVTAI
jgi:hypothetical protein